MLARLALTSLALLGLGSVALAAPTVDDTAMGLAVSTDEAPAADAPLARKTTRRRTSGHARPAGPAHRPAGPAHNPAGPAYRPAGYRPPAHTYGSGPRPSAHPAPPRTTHAVPAHRPAPAPRAYVAARVHTHYAPPQIHHHYRPAPRRHVVVYHHPIRAYHGVFVYGPRPVYHTTYVHRAQPQVQQAHLPTRRVDRDGTMAIGLRSGALYSGYDDGYVYGDLGLGGTLRFRPEESLGLEVALTHHDQTWDEGSDRHQTVGQASAILYAFPWSRVSPYVLGGLTYTARSVDDCDEPVTNAVWGPHAGAGIELAIGEDVALDLEARYISYLNAPSDDPTLPGAVQTTAGLVFHF